MKNLFLSALTAALVCACFYVFGHADASRNSSGTMSAINGPYISGTTISSTTVNNRLADVETEITDSLSRSGKGHMTAQLTGTDGTVAAPAYSFTSEPGSGLYRIGAGDLGWAILGVKKLELTAVAFTSSGIVRAPDGTAASPGYIFTSEDDGSGTGFYMGAAQSMRASVNGSEVWRWEPTQVRAAVNLNATAGVTIGTTGTAITASYRGTTSWTPGSVTAGNCVTTSITVTGASSGTECSIGRPNSTANALGLSCQVTADTCNLWWCNASAGSLTAPTGTYTCRVFNP